jgi:hypothetical protein
MSAPKAMVCPAAAVVAPLVKSVAASGRPFSAATSAPVSVRT